MISIDLEHQRRCKMLLKRALLVSDRGKEGGQDRSLRIEVSLLNDNC